MPDTTPEPSLQPLNAAVIPRFAEAATFMRTPRVNDATKVDIALVGVPFDLGTGFRTGARQGPAQIREMSRIIRRVNATSRIAPFRLCNVADMGDAPINPFDLLGSVDAITAFFKNLAAAQRRADRRRRRSHDHAADPARPLQGRALRRRAFRRPRRHARHLSRHQDQPRHAVPPAGGGGHPRSQAHDPDRPARHPLRRRRHPVRLRRRHAHRHHGRFRGDGAQGSDQGMPARLRHRPDLHHLRHRRARSRLLHRHRRAGAGRPLHARRPGDHPRPAGHESRRRRRLRGAAAGRSLRPHGARTPPT